MTRRELVASARAGLRALALDTRVREALPPSPRGGLPARVIAIGKAAPAMAAGALGRWGRAIERCMVVAPDGTDVSALAPYGAAVEVLRAAHPLPDGRSVRAAETCLEAVATRDPTQVLVLVSGGASALVCAPSSGVRLVDKRGVTEAMLRSGACVQDVNVVRKHLSRIKGGGLLRASWPNPVLSLVASDVIGGLAADVGSGPSVPDPSSVTDARALVRRFAPSFAHLPFARTLAVDDPRARQSRARIVASPEQLARAVAGSLETSGLRVRLLRPSQEQVSALADDYLALAGRATAPSAFVRAAEPSIDVPPGAGRGGRSTHLAALVGAELPRGARFLAMATDGVDGNSGTAGAVVDSTFGVRVTRLLGEDALARALDGFDTGPLHRALATALPLSPTGHNLADLHVLVTG